MLSGSSNQKVDMTRWKMWISSPSTAIYCSTDQFQLVSCQVHGAISFLCDAGIRGNSCHDAPLIMALLAWTLSCCILHSWGLRTTGNTSTTKKQQSKTSNGTYSEEFLGHGWHVTTVPFLRIDTTAMETLHQRWCSHGLKECIWCEKHLVISLQWKRRWEIKNKCNIKAKNMVFNE